MTVFVTDTFTDTDAVVLASHTGELGATWTEHSSDTSATAPEILTNQLIFRGASVTNNIYYASGTPASANYTVSLDFIPGSGGPAAGEIVGPLGRVDTAATTYYGALFLQSSGGIRLYRFASGTGTVIVAAVAFTASAGVAYTITLDMSGTGATVTVAGRVQRSSDSNWLTSGGTWQAGQIDFGSYSDVDATRITSAGKAGLWASQANSGADSVRSRIDNFSADAEVSAGLSIPVAMNQYRKRRA